MGKSGRPSKYNKLYDEQVEKLCLLGATEKEIADFFSVNPDTIAEWKNVHPSFSESLNRGRDTRDSRVEKSLLERAEGYVCKEEKVLANGTIITVNKYYPPDTTACIFWLKNRQRDKWRDKQEIDHSSSDGTMTPKYEIEIVKPSDDKN